MDTNEFERVLGVLLDLEARMAKRLTHKPNWVPSEIQEELRQARIDIQEVWLASPSDNNERE